MDDQKKLTYLIDQMRIADNTTALRIVRKFRTDGWLTAGPLRFADLRRARLAGADLRDADMLLSKLNHADLSGANLSGINLRRAKLSRVSFAGANLTDADMRESDLTNADLSHAVLYRTELRGADFTGVSLLNTVFADVDLSKVKGLEAVQHRGPSTIGVDTLFKSKGHIPDEFLSGCGVDDQLLQYLPGMVGEAVEYYDCFISFTPGDFVFAERLSNTLQSRGITCWLDEHPATIQDHELIRDEIHPRVRFWDRMILCCSKEYMKSLWMESVFRAYLGEESTRNETNAKMPILLPIDLDGYLNSDTRLSKVASQIKDRLLANAVGWADNLEAYDSVVKQIVAIVQPKGKRATLEQKLATANMSDSA
jgi:uncharacterized protein YjbI with pentapeptide repeats